MNPPQLIQDILQADGESVRSARGGVRTAERWRDLLGLAMRDYLYQDQSHAGREPPADLVEEIVETERRLGMRMEDAQ